MLYQLLRFLIAALVLVVIGAWFYYVVIDKPEEADEQTLLPPIDQTLHSDRVYIGKGFLQLTMGGWQRNMGWPLAPYSVLASGDSLVLQTEKDHPFQVERIGDQPLPKRPPMVYEADAYRYVPVDSGLIQVPRWQWRSMIERLNRLEKRSRR